MKRVSMKHKDVENRENLNAMMTEVDTSAADEQEAEQAYKAKLAALEEQEAVEKADIERRKAAIDAAKEAMSIQLVNAPDIRLASDDTHKAQAAPVFDSLSNFGKSLDLSAIRAKFAVYGDTIADSLTEFMGTSAIENVALPVCRLRALSRIASDEKAMKVIEAAKTPDGKTTYGKTKAPLSRFLMDVLNLSKQQVSAYTRVVRYCVDKTTNELKPEFHGFSFTQLDILSTSRNPVENATKVDVTLSSKDFKAAISRLDTEAATMAANTLDGQPDGTNAANGQPNSQPDGTNAANGQPDGTSAANGQPDGTSAANGQPDGTNAANGQPDAKPADNLVSFVVGNVPANNAVNFVPQAKPDGKPIVSRAANLTAAVNLFCERALENRVMFRLPKAAEKAIVDTLPAAFNGYSVKAIIGDVVGTFGHASLYALATIVTVGTSETDETSKQAAKRIETARVVLANWLTGAAKLEGIPAAVETENAMDIFKRAYESVQNTPRMSAQVALATMYNAGMFITDARGEEMAVAQAIENGEL